MHNISPVLLRIGVLHVYTCTCDLLYTLQAVKQFQGAVNTLHSVQEKAQSLCSLSDVCTYMYTTPCSLVQVRSLPKLLYMSIISQDLYLPVQTLLVEAQLQLAETLLKVFEEYDLGLRESRNKRQQKSCIEKVYPCYMHTATSTILSCVFR